MMVKLSEIDPPVIDQRDKIDPQKIIELAESIREKGLLQPILLRPLNGRYEIVFGHRRYLAHKHLGAQEINAEIKELDDTQVVVFRAIENLQRENLSPMEEARAYYMMMKEGGMSIGDICIQTGKSKATISRFLRLWDMPPNFQEAVDKKEVPIGVAEALIKIDDPNMRDYYLKMAVENGITVNVAEIWVSDYFKSRKGEMLEGAIGSGDGEENIEIQPVYVTCQVCGGPVEIRKARQIIGCVECINPLRRSKIASR